MKTLRLVSIAVIVSAMLAATPHAFAAKGERDSKGTYRPAETSSMAATSSTADSVSAGEAADLAFMREEEKLARDVYLTLDSYWGTETKVFANIAKSEQTHTSTVEYILSKFDVDDPVIRDELGVFVNDELQALYDTLAVKGSASLIEGLYVGALIEEKDMRDILAAIDRTDERAIALAYSNLLDGSKDHLRAFVSVIESLDLAYNAQVLSQEEVDMILSSGE
ncbi:MAG: DUF2202 domain-containing protein [Alcanivoracaceae bacterium]|nr:DUF2202 domain-containing protein [Alcanivoracaceae bacterium]